MKSLILTILTFVLTTISLCAQGKWEIVNEGSDFSVFEIDFINVNTAWALGEKGIHKTNDGGNTWLSIWEGKPFEFLTIDFINDSIGWALKGLLNIDSLQIHKTLDGGQTWFQQKSVNYGQSAFDNNLYTVNDSIVYALGESLVKTIDGGTSWIDITPPGGSDFNIGSFPNADTGIVISRDDNDVKSLFRTFNGGEDWEGKSISGFRNIYDITFLNDSIGYFRADEFPSEIYRLYKTTDSFKSWFAITDEKYSIYGCHFFDDNLVLSIMEDSTGTNLMKSKDGGMTWEYWGDFKMPANWDNKIYFFENVGYLYCNTGVVASGIIGGLLLRTVNQGISWNGMNFSYPLKDVFFIDETKGFLAGGHEDPHFIDGKLIRTDDGFKTFDFPLGGAWVPGKSFYLYRSCHFTSDSVGFYTDGYLMKTSDGGKSWIRDTGLDDNVVVDICFINNSTAYAITHPTLSWGTYGKDIYKTTDGASSWNKFYTGDEDDYKELISIFFIDENTGWVLGWSEDYLFHNIGDGRPIIIKYSEEQGWRNIPIDTSLPLNKVLFINQDIGWIAGGYGNWNGHEPLFLRTEDGGESWSEVKEMKYFINDFHFETEVHGWSVGQDSIGRGAVLETFDGGLNWEVAIDSLSGSLRALHIQNGYGWAVGDNGLVLKTEYTSTTGIGQDNPVIVGGGHQLSNYPNPFQSKTTINYQLQASTHVELSIFDLSGRKVASLINELQPAGKHELEWNAGDMQPGVYICELKTNMGKQVIKMILTE